MNFCFNNLKQNKMSINTNFTNSTTFFYTPIMDVYEALGKAFDSMYQTRKEKVTIWNYSDSNGYMRVFTQLDGKKCAIIRFEPNGKDVSAIFQHFCVRAKLDGSRARKFYVDFVSFGDPTYNIRHILYPRAVEETGKQQTSCDCSECNKTFVTLCKYGGKTEMDELALESKRNLCPNADKMQSLIRICNTIVCLANANNLNEIADDDNLLCITRTFSTSKTLIETATSAVVGELNEQDDEEIREFVKKEIVSTCVRVFEKIVN